MRNGITDQLTEFNVTGNSSLTCIETLDPDYATANWTSANENIDAGVTFSVICGSENQDEWYVATTGSDGGGSGTQESPLATIQTGINASGDGNTVHVAAGTYVENIDYDGKTISVIGADRETTIIDGNESGRAFRYYSSGNDQDFRISGFTIKNGLYEDGAGMVINNSQITLENLIIKDNYATHNSGGINVSGGNPIIKNCIVKNNNAGWAMGGIGFHQTNAKVINTLFTNNGPCYGSAFSSWTGSNVELHHTTVVNNTGGWPIAAEDNSNISFLNSIDP